MLRTLSNDPKNLSNILKWHNNFTLYLEDYCDNEQGVTIRCDTMIQIKVNIGKHDFYVTMQWDFLAARGLLMDVHHTSIL